MAETQQQHAPLDVLIAGGGIVGLTLAVALARALPGLRLAIHDPAFAAPPPDELRAYAIAAGSRRMLEQLELWQALEPVAEPMTQMLITDTALEEPVRQPVLTFGDGEGADAEPFAHMVPARPLLAALLAAAERLGITMVAGGITGFRQGLATLDVTTQAGETLPARLLVAADGGRSRLRARAGIPFNGWGYGQSAIVTTVEHERPHHGRAVQHFLPSGPFAILPLPGNRSSIVWSERDEVAERMLKADPERFRAHLAQRFGGMLGEVSVLVPPKAYPLRLGLARRLTAERFALMGDAAHVVHPIAGQGLNLGLKDAAALAEAIVEHVRLGGDPGDLPVLEAYERARRFDTARLAFTTDVLNRLFSNDLGPLRALRNLGMGLVQRLPSLKAMFIGEAAGGGADMPRLMRGQAL